MSHETNETANNRLSDAVQKNATNLPLNIRLVEFLEALKSTDLDDGDLRITNHSSSVITSDWERVQTAIKNSKKSS